MADEVVPGLAEAIESRRKQLRLSPGDFVSVTGLTAPGLAPLRKGHRRNYQEKLKLAVADALRWTPDSIDRLLRGEPAVTLEEHLAALRATQEALLDARGVRQMTLDLISPDEDGYNDVRHELDLFGAELRRLDAEIALTVTRIRGKADTFDDAELDRLTGRGQRSDIVAGLHGKIDQLADADRDAVEALVDRLLGRGD